MEQLVILLLIGLIGFINWVIQQAAEARKRRELEQKRDRGEEMPPPLTSESLEPASQDNPDDGMRKLMEALGLPQDALPPPVPRRQEAYVPPPLPTPSVAVQRSFRVAEPVPTNPAVLQEQARKFQAATSRIRTLLASPEGVRDGVILAEILGSPKAFR